MPRQLISNLATVTLIVAGLLTLSCKQGNDTSVVIHVVSDGSLGLDAIDMLAQPVTDPDAGQTGRVTSEHFANPSSVTWFLFPEGADKSFAIQVEARGMKNGVGDPVVVQRAVLSFQSGQRIEITMTLESRCVGVQCGPKLTCQAGQCIDPGTVGSSIGEDGGVVDAPDARDAPADLPAGGDARRDGDARPDAAASDALPKQLGASCGSDLECGSNHCADGVCCNQICAGSCQQCDSTAMPGYCVAVPSGQAAPPKHTPCSKDDVATCKQTGLCDGMGACQLYADGQLCNPATCNPTANTLTDSRCDGMGTCKTGTALSCAPFRCKTGDVLCARTCMTTADCDGQPCLAGSCGKLKTGSTCAVDADCELGFCVDSVCCNVRCAGQCQSCGLSTSVGTCTNLKSGQPVGTRTPCGGTGACAGSCLGQPDCSFPDTTTNCRPASCTVSTLTAAANCNGAGVCPAVSTSSCAAHLRCQTGTASCLIQCATPADCLPGFYCAGTVCTATKALGASCAAAAECGSSLCVDGVCCSTACNGSCQTCTKTPGTCSTVINADDDTCTGATTCGTAGTCLKKQAQTCAAAGECANGLCVDGHCCNSSCAGACMSCSTGTCSTVANADDSDTCTGGLTCNGLGACVNKQGQVCTTGGECSSGMCVDSRCCNTTCAGTCQTCATGTCGTVTNADDVGTCTGTMTCNATGACLLKQAQACTTAAQCATGNCVDGHCCNTACAGTCQTCATGTCGTVSNADDVGTCTGTMTCNATGACLLKQAQTCTTAAQCATGNCVDGHCCNTACAGTCQTCTTGTCGTVTNADDVGTCTGTMTCNATGACLLKQAQTCTTAAQCATGNCVDGHCCDTACNGTCLTCNSAAAPGKCSTVANADDDTCGGTSTCNASGACLLKQGQACTTAAQCANGMCVDGRCCNSTCTGSCMNCNLASSPGTCSPVMNADDNTCTGTMTCNAVAACLPKQGQVCTTSSQCANGLCVDGRCCNSVCNGLCQTCNSTAAPGTCSLVASADDDTCTGINSCNAAGSCLLKQGQACTVGTQCVTGLCVDGRCCNGACNGQCQTCALASALGTCSPVRSGDDIGTCSGTSTCNAAGACITCTSTQTNCGGACLSLMSDNNNCGACGHVCGAGLACCAGACVDTQSTASHCGASCIACGGTTPKCLTGTCVQCAVGTDCPGTGSTCQTNHTCACRAPRTTNAIPNSSFNQNVMLTGWTLSDGVGGGQQTPFAFWSPNDADGCPASGSMALQFVTSRGMFGTFQQCIPVTPNLTYEFGLKAATGTIGGNMTCTIGTDGCPSNSTGNDFFPPSFFVPPDSSILATFAAMPTTIVETGPTTTSISISCTIFGGTVYVDQMYLDPTVNSF